MDAARLREIPLLRFGSTTRSDDPRRLTRGFAADPALRELVHRFELFNRTTLFGWVAREGLSAVACGDFHRLEHLAGWKTLLPCALQPLLTG